MKQKQLCQQKFFRRKFLKYEFSLILQRKQGRILPKKFLKQVKKMLFSKARIQSQSVLLKTRKRAAGICLLTAGGKLIFSFSLTFLMSLFFARCSSCVPCQKFNRATFIPFLHICVRISSSSQAGAMVQIILVFRIFQNTFLYYNSKADTLCGGHTASDCPRKIK